MREISEREREEEMRARGKSVIVPFFAPLLSSFKKLYLASLLSIIVLDNSLINSQEDFLDT